MLKRIMSAVIAVTMVVNMAMPTVYAMENAEHVQDDTLQQEQIIIEETNDNSVDENVEEGKSEATADTEQTVTEEIVISEEFVQKYTAADFDLPSNDEIFAAYVEQQFYDNSFSVFGVSAREHLNDAEKAIYDFLKAEISEVAKNGGSTVFTLERPSSIGVKATWTAEELGVEHIVSTEEIARLFTAQFDFKKIHQALLTDCPYELYWYNKTIGVSFRCGYSGMPINDGSGIPKYTKLNIINYEVSFNVSDNYSDNYNSFAVTPEVSRVDTAVNNAKNIADKYKNETKYNKLVAFKDEICSLVTYDHSAASGGNFTQNDDPWQLINVFDGDAATNVVCEGYSKAFQYLCDLAGIECYIVSGQMDGGTGAGGHMWNIVVLDGVNYLADVTNSDEGTIGSKGQLFLAGTQGSPQNGYAFLISKQYVTYAYYTNMFSLWGEDILTLSPVNYNANSANTEYGISLDGGWCGAALSWNIYDSDSDGTGDTLVISGSGDMYDYTPESMPWSAYKDTIKTVDIINGVTSVGSNAFAGCSSLKKLLIPETVTSIKTGAVDNCEALEDITYVGSDENWNNVEINTGNDIFQTSGVTRDPCFKGHFWVEASCEAPRHCSRCNLTEGEVLPHTPEVMEKTEPTCTETGLTEGSKCSVCDLVLIPQDIIDALGHEEVVDEASAPTCTETGLTEGVHCSVCEEIIKAQEVVPATGHSFTNYIPNGDGTQTAKCDNCDETVTEVIGSFSGDCGENVKWIVYDADEDGVDETLIINGHGVMNDYDAENPAPWSVFLSNINNVAVKENVTSIGAYAFYNCANITEITLPASLAAVGENAFTGCTSINKVYYYGTQQQWNDIFNEDNAVPETAKIIITGSFGENLVWTLTDENADGAKETLTVIGTGEMTDVSAEMPAPWKVYSDTVETVIVSEGITVIGDKAFEDFAALKVIDMPSTLVEIGDNAFKNCDAIAEFTVPGNVKTIGEHAFAQCEALKTVTLEQGVETIGRYAFAYCPEIETLSLADSITEIRTAAFCELGKLTAVNIPASLTQISAQLFKECTSLEEVVIPEGVVSIGITAFAKCSSLTTVSLPSTLVDLDETSFADCADDINIVYNGTAQDWFEKFYTKLGQFKNEKYTFTSGNTAFVKNENTDTESYRLVYWADAAGDVVIPEEYNGLPVTAIAEKLFENNALITSVVIPEGITTIFDEAFSGCTALETVTIPVSLNVIGNDIFKNCDALSVVNYNGTAQQWIDIIDGRIIIDENTVLNCAGGNMAFALIPDGNGGYRDEYGVVMYISGESDIVIPGTYNNLPVTQVGRVFKGDHNLKSVVLSENIRYIENNAFEDCINLESVTIPDSMKIIGEDAFKDCENLKNVYYPSQFNWFNGPLKDNDVLNSVVEENIDNGINQFETDWGYTFDYNDEGEKVAHITGKSEVYEKLVIPAEIRGVKVTEILRLDDTYHRVPAFGNCTNLKSVTISEGIEVIDFNAFDGCTNIEEIFIPRSFKLFYGNTDSAFIGVPREAKIYILEAGYKSFFQSMGFQNVIVYKTITSLKVANISVIYNGEDAVLPKITTVPAKGAVTELEWTVAEEDKDIIEIVTDANGEKLIRGKELGLAKLIVTDAKSGLTATSTVTVTVKALNGTLDNPIDSIGLQSGDSRTITITDDNDEVIPAEKIEFTSSAADVSVDDTGKITSNYTGTSSKTVTVTAALKHDKTKAYKLSVKAIPKQTAGLEIVAEYDNPEIKTEVKDGVQIIVIPRSLVTGSTLPISLKAVAKDAEDNVIAANVKWASDAANIAKAVATKGTKDSADVTISKNADGLAVITATANDLKKSTATIEIDVRDYTPRLENNSLTLNTYLEEGVQTKLYTAYVDEVIQINSVSISGTDSEKFYVLYNAENGTVTFNSHSPMTANKQYKLTLNVNTEKGETSQPVTLKVTNKLPAVTVKQATPFELFYKDSTTDVTVTVKDAVITAVEMPETATFTASAYDAVKEGITISYKNTSDPLSTFVNNKPDAKTKLFVSFEGYRTSFEVKNFTIKTKETAVKLTPSRTGTKYRMSVGGNSPITLMDSKTKEVIDLTNCTVKVDEEYVSYSKNGTELTIVPKLTDGSFIVNGRAATNYTANVTVQAADWLREVKVTHKFTFDTKTVPSVKFKTGTVKLNRAFDTAAETVIVPNLENCASPEWTVTAIPSPAQKKDIEKFNAEAAKLKISTDGWNVRAEFDDADNTPEKGKYAFQFTGTVDGVELKAVTLTVDVSETLPNVQLSKTSVKLNRALKDDTVIPFKAVPAGYELTGAEITAAADNALTESDISVKYEDGKVVIKALNNDITAGKYKYNVLPKVKLSGIEYSKESYVAKAQTITVDVFSKEVKDINVTYTAKGKIDLVARETGIVYTLTKGTNFAYEAEDVDTATFALTDHTDKFDITYLGTDAKGQHMVEVTAKPEAQLKKGVKYNLNISVKTDDMDEAVKMVKDVTITPNQSAVKVVAKGSTTIYQSYKGTNSLTVKATSPAGVKIKSVTIDTKATTVPEGVNVVISDTPNPDGSWDVNYTLINASKVKVNRTYKLALKVMPEGGDETVKPTVVNVTLKVKR